MVVNGDRSYRCRYEATLKMCVASVASGITPEVWLVPWGWLANMYIQFVLNLGQWSMSGLITINQYKSGECHHCPAIIYNVLFWMYPSSSMVWFPWFPLGHWARILFRGQWSQESTSHFPWSTGATCPDMFQLTGAICPLACSNYCNWVQWV
jgi:hypothetical protein